MDISRDRTISLKEIVCVFAVCVFPIYTWATLHSLREFPAWILYLNNWELVGVISYIFAFALFESLLVLLIISISAFLLPGRFLRKRFVAQSSFLILLTAIWAIVGHFNNAAISSWGLKNFLFWSGVYVASAAFSIILIRRFSRLEEVINALAERLTVFIYIYGPLSVLSVIILILRSI